MAPTVTKVVMIDVLDITEPPSGVGYVYRWSNLVNGRMYIGSHDGSNPKYRASGIAVRSAFEKYGHENFKREFLYVGPDFRQEEERLLCLVDAANNRDYYNLKNTAIGFGSKDNPNLGRFGANHPKFGKVMSEESKKRMSDDRKGDKSWGRSGEKNHNFGKQFSAETRKKIGDAQRGMIRGPMSEERKTHLSELNKGKVYPKRKCPYCPKIGGGGAMGKYHFDNCKQKEKGIDAKTT